MPAPPQHPAPPPFLWESLPPAQRQQLTRLLARLLNRQLAARNATGSPTKKETVHEPPPQNS
jgi:hypothetical protein